MKRFLLGLTFIAAAGSLLAQPEPMPRDHGWPETVHVTGTSHTRVTPDRVTFTVGVQTVANTVEDATTQNNQKMAAVTAALRKAGATDREIQTSNFSIYPQQDYSEQGKPPRITGYQVMNNLTITREKIADAGRLLQAAVNAGVNTSSGLTFLVSDPTRGRDEGLKAAFADAHSKAAILAAAASRTLGRALSIHEGGGEEQPPRPMMMQARAMSAKADVGEIPVEAGTQELSFTLSVTFELR